MKIDSPAFKLSDIHSLNGTVTDHPVSYVSDTSELKDSHDDLCEDRSDQSEVLRMIKNELSDRGSSCDEFFLYDMRGRLIPLL